MSEDKAFIEKTQPKNILEIINKDVLKRLLDSYRFPLQTALTVYYPVILPTNIENLSLLELKEEPGLYSPFCSAYWHKPDNPKAADEYCWQTSKKYDKQITLKYYEGKWSRPKLFRSHLSHWDMTYPLFAGGQLVGVLYGGWVIVTEYVEDWRIGLEDVINEIAWNPFDEKGNNVIPSKSDQIREILAAVDARDDITPAKKKQLRIAVKEEKRRKIFVEDLVRRYEEFKEFGKTLEGVMEDLYAAKAEAARHEHIHLASRLLNEAGDHLTEEKEKFWETLDDVVKNTLPDVKGYVLYALEEYGEEYSPAWMCLYDKELISEKAAFRNLCKYVFDELREKRKEKKHWIAHDILDKEKTPSLLRDLFQRGVSDWNKFSEGAKVVAVSLTGEAGKIVGGLICACKENKQISIKQSGPSDFYIETLVDVADVLSVVLARYAAKERRERELGRLTHELKVPLVAIRGAAEFMSRTPGIKDVFDYDYIGDIWSWSELMGRLIDKADVLRYSEKKLDIKPVRIFILRDVIESAIRQTKLLLEERGFSRMNISYSKERFLEFPPLWVDRNMFQQVMSNLLVNAVKYAYNDPAAFRVEIEGNERDLTIVFRDWGPGIDDGLEELIFKEGFRGPNAVEADVTGQGLGLWIVRQIVEAHGGKVKATNLKHPTEFTIWLPRSLASQPPALNKGD